MWKTPRAARRFTVQHLGDLKQWQGCCWTLGCTWTYLVLLGTFDDWKRKLNMILLNDFFLGGNLRNFVRVSSWIHLGGRFGDFEASSSDGSWCSEWLAVGRCVHEIWITTIACSLVLILAYMMLCIIVMYLMAGKFRWLGCEHEHPVKHWMIHPICWHQFQVVFTYSFRMFSRVQDTII